MIGIWCFSIYDIKQEKWFMARAINWNSFLQVDLKIIAMLMNMKLFEFNNFLFCHNLYDIDCKYHTYNIDIKSSVFWKLLKETQLDIKLQHFIIALIFQATKSVSKSDY